MRAAVPILASFVLAVPPAVAQHRPLATQDPVPVPAGHVRVEAGVEYLPDRAFPLSGLQGDLWRIPRLGFSIGFGRAELQLDAGYQAMDVEVRDEEAPLEEELDFDGDVSADIVDPVVAIKVLLRHEGRFEPAVGVRVATKIPSADASLGLGSDATDFFATLLAAKSIGGARVTANFGLGVLGVPENGHRQNDVLTYGLSVVAPIAGRWSAVAEANGRVDRRGEPAPGTEDLGQARLGVRREDRVRLDAAVIVGLADPEPDLGLTVGATVEFDAFENTR